MGNQPGSTQGSRPFGSPVPLTTYAQPVAGNLLKPVPVPASTPGSGSSAFEDVSRRSLPTSPSGGLPNGGRSRQHSVAANSIPWKLADNVPVPLFLNRLARELGRGPDEISDIAEMLKANWYDDVGSLRTITDWDALDLPLRLTAEIRKQIFALSSAPFSVAVPPLPSTAGISPGMAPPRAFAPPAAVSEPSVRDSLNSLPGFKPVDAAQPHPPKYTVSLGNGLEAEVEVEVASVTGGPSKSKRDSGGSTGAVAAAPASGARARIGKPDTPRSGTATPASARGSSSRRLSSRASFDVARVPVNISVPAAGAHSPETAQQRAKRRVAAARAAKREAQTPREKPGTPRAHTSRPTSILWRLVEAQEQVKENDAAVAELKEALAAIAEEGRQKDEAIEALRAEVRSKDALLDALQDSLAELVENFAEYVEHLQQGGASLRCLTMPLRGAGAGAAAAGRPPRRRSVDGDTFDEPAAGAAAAAAAAAAAGSAPADKAKVANWVASLPDPANASPGGSPDRPQQRARGGEDKAAGGGSGEGAGEVTGQVQEATPSAAAAAAAAKREEGGGGGGAGVGRGTRDASVSPVLRASAISPRGAGHGGEGGLAIAAPSPPAPAAAAVEPAAAIAGADRSSSAPEPPGPALHSP
eukprot:tig00000254_g22511.t1